MRGASWSGDPSPNRDAIARGPTWGKGPWRGVSWPTHHPFRDDVSCVFLSPLINFNAGNCVELSSVAAQAFQATGPLMRQKDGVKAPCGPYEPYRYPLQKLVASLQQQVWSLTGRFGRRPVCVRGGGGPARNPDKETQEPLASPGVWGTYG